MPLERFPSSTASAPADSRLTGPGSGWLRALLLGAIVLLLTTLVVVPPWIGAVADKLRDQLTQVVFPAHEALQESQTALSEALAAARGYQLSGDSLFLARLRGAVAREGAASDRLTLLAAQLGPETVRAVEEFRVRSGAWLEGPRALLVGAATRDELVRTVSLGQQRFETSIAAADGARAALTRSQAQLEDQIRAVTGLARRLVALLSLVALAVALVVGWMIYRLHHLSQQHASRAERLRESEERFRLIAENLREMIWISDPAYTVHYYLSPAYETIWGRPIETARKNPRSFLESVLPQDRERVEAALEGYVLGEYEAEYRVVRPDGQVRWISGRAYPVRDEHERVVHVVGIAEDITEQKHTEEERERLLESERRAHAETEAALHMRDRVLGIVSHDLKNPLHTIGMAAELLEMRLPEERRTQQLDIIRRTVARANRMVLDLLDAARIESGQAVAVEPQPLAVRPLLDEAIEAFRLQAEEKRQQLICDASETIAPVHADHDRVLQALSNLIGNAVKFTPEGGQICVRAEPGEDGTVRFSVSDTGPGIPPEILPHLFEPFAQAKDTASLGTGLGLSIARGIVEAHGGQLGVRSGPGSGTEFAFTLPTTQTA